MSIPFNLLRSNEVLTFQPGETKFVMFRDVSYNPGLRGTLQDGTEIVKPGLVFIITAASPATSAREWRLWNKRSISMFEPLINSGEFRNRWIRIQRTGQGPTSDYVPSLMPVDWNPTS